MKQSVLALTFIILALTVPEGRCAEVALVTENEDRSLAVSLLEPLSGATQSVLSSFATVDAQPFLGAYVASTERHIGAITANSSGATWQLIDRLGNAAGTLSLGKAGDVFIAGADFNGDGLFDPAVVESIQRSLKVRAKLGAFAPSPGNEVTRSIGTLGDKALTFFANLDGQGDRIGTVRKLPRFLTSKPRYFIRLTNPIDGSKRTVVLASIGEIKLAPLPLKLGNGTDGLVFQRPLAGSSAGIRVTVIKKNGRRRGASFTFSGEGSLVIGDFDESDPGEELGFHSGTNLTIVNPTSRASRTVLIPAGVVIDGITVGALSPETDSAVACGGTPGICGCNFLDETDGYKIGFVYKAKSDTYGGIVAVLPNPCGRSTTAVSVLDRSCNVIEQLSDNGYGNADQTGVRHHFKRRDDHTGSYYRNLVGSIILRLDGTDGCYMIDDPAKSRID